MSIFEIVAGILLTVLLMGSAWLNIFLVKRLLTFSENVSSVASTIADFRKHVETVNELEKYYGDDTLESLLEHSKETAAAVSEFEDLYYAEEE